MDSTIIAAIIGGIFLLMAAVVSVLLKGEAGEKGKAQGKKIKAIKKPKSNQPGQMERPDVFLSYSHSDAEWVGNLAIKLEDEESLSVWLDKWILIPGKPWQQEIARGLDRAKCCVVCIGENTPDGWFREEIEKALNRQTQDSSFRVIPTLIPNAKKVNVDNFLDLRTWVDFREKPDFDRSFYYLVCGIKNIPPGRWKPDQQGDLYSDIGIETKLLSVKRLRDGQYIDKEISQEYQRKYIDELLGDK